jgi:hypothetical protein
MIIIDNRRFDKNIYDCNGNYCEECGKSKFDSNFYKDELNSPIYFQILSKDKAVMFCGCECCNKWSIRNKSLIWNRKI